jgi:hypothetical protein
MLARKLPHPEIWGRREPYRTMAITGVRMKMPFPTENLRTGGDGRSTLQFGDTETDEIYILDITLYSDTSTMIDSPGARL